MNPPATCPHAPKVRADLPPLIPRIAALPVDDRGYPIPFFVERRGCPPGAPDFRVMDRRRWSRCVREHLCWVCGQKLGRHLSFLIGPMCVVNRTTAEPPAHLDCAEWSAQACPFLSKPSMKRREAGLPEDFATTGEMIMRNPGAMAIWTTRTYDCFPDGRGSNLIEIGPVETIAWWREGRPATRAEVLESIESGLPILRAACDKEPSPERVAEAHAEIDRRMAVAFTLLPRP